MKTIWKYTLEVIDDQILEMPEGAKILTVQVQNGKPQLWAVVYTNLRKTEKRHIRIHGTGHELSDDKLNYISTFQMNNGLLVFHVFEVLN